MSPVTKIAVRRIRADRFKNGSLCASLLISMLLIGFLLAFVFRIRLHPGTGFESLPIGDFLGQVSLYMNLAAGILILVTLMSVRIQCAIRREENAQLIGVLKSIGARGRDIRALMRADILFLYLPPTVIGAALGIGPGALAGRIFSGAERLEGRECLPFLLLFLITAGAGILLILLAHLLPPIRRRSAIIQAIRRQNPTVGEQTHGYRQSKTFRQKALVKRLAQKSNDYHAKFNTRMMLLFADSAVYPMLAVMLFWKIGSEDVILDANPFDGADTAGAAADAVGGVLLFLAIGFALLTGIGLVQAMLMARIRMAERQKAADIYRMIGMEPEDIRRMLRAEISGTAARTAVLLIFLSLLLWTAFTVAGG